jgi:hypothetical protein
MLDTVCTNKTPEFSAGAVKIQGAHVAPCYFAEYGIFLKYCNIHIPANVRFW